MDLPFEEYRAAIIDFAVTAKRLYIGVEKCPSGLWDFYVAFWQEYNELLARFGGPPPHAPGGLHLSVVDEYGLDVRYAVVW